MRAPLRAGFALGLCCVAAAACDPWVRASFAVAPAVAPRPAAAGADSAWADSAWQAAVFASVARVAAGHGLRPAYSTDAGGWNEEGWRECFTGPSSDRETRQLFLCGKVKGREAYFEMHQAMASRFSPSAVRLRRALLDSLRAQFGAAQVREASGR
jgi:hypothetical protein